MSTTGTDIWANWLLRRRHGGDPELLRRTLAFLAPIRDKVLDNAQFTDGGTLLDVGCGDGLIAFGALHRNSTGRVIFSDISQELIGHSENLIREMGHVERCSFICA